MNIHNNSQDFNTQDDYVICNCGRETVWYPEKGYKEFWLQDPDIDEYRLYDIDDIPSDDPYDAIEHYIEQGTLGYIGDTFDNAPIFILATMQGGE